MKEELMSLIGELRDLADRIETAAEGESGQEDSQHESGESDMSGSSPEKSTPGNKVGAALLSLKKRMGK